MEPNDNAMLMEQFSALVIDMNAKGFNLFDTNIQKEPDTDKIFHIEGVFIYGMFSVRMGISFVKSG